MRERTSEQWLADLRGPNPDEALADLYELLVRGLRAALVVMEAALRLTSRTSPRRR